MQLIRQLSLKTLLSISQNRFMFTPIVIKSKFQYDSL